MDDSIRFLDPVRWQAAEDGLFLLKRSHVYLGCLGHKTFEFSTSMIAELELSLQEDINDDNIYYECFDTKGNSWYFTYDIKVEVEMV